MATIASDTGWAMFPVDTHAGGYERRLWVKIDKADWDRVHEHTWHLTQDGPLVYAQTMLSGPDGQRLGSTSLGRFLLGYGTLGNLGRVDHRNHNGLDCRRANLCLSTQAQIMARRRPAGGVSAFKGVAWDGAKNRWMACYRGKRIGRFVNERDAARAFDEAVLEHHRDSKDEVYLNFPIPQSGVPMTGAKARLLRFAVGQCMATEPYQKDPDTRRALAAALETIQSWVDLPTTWLS